MTSHDATSFNVHRGTLRNYSHEVDGIAYIGGRGTRLDGLIQQTYVDEANCLATDLVECLAALPPALAQMTLDGMKGALSQAAEQRPDVFTPDSPNVAVVDVDQVLFDGPVVVDAPPDPQPEPPAGGNSRRRRGRNGDDAVSALDQQRADDTGQIDTLS